MNIKNLIFDILFIILMVLGILNELVINIPAFIIIPLACICIIYQVYRIIMIIKAKNNNKKA